MSSRTRRAVPSISLLERSAPVLTGALRCPTHVPQAAAHGDGDGDGAGVVSTGSGRVDAGIVDRRAAGDGSDVDGGLPTGLGVGLGVGVGAGTVVDPRDVFAGGEGLAIGEGEGLGDEDTLGDG